MNVLQVNKFFYPRAGTEMYMFALSERLRARGHGVRFFSMEHPANASSEDARYFVREKDFHEAQGLAKLRLAANVVFSREARSRISGMLDEVRPDVAHLHNFHHQLSPSILKPLSDRGIPIVMTVHDLKVACPNYLMLSHGAICERCRCHRYYHCFLQGCVKESRLGSLVNTVEMTVHWLLRSHERIHRFLCPSRFYRDKLIEWGLPGEKVLHVPNFVETDGIEPGDGDDGSVLYAGRISKEKGIPTLLRALSRAPGVRCVIAGSGPGEEFARSLARELGLTNVEFPGRLSADEVRRAMAMCRAVILPSEWYENGPISVLEAFALGKPVIGARIGGIPEPVRHEETGWLFRPGDAGELASLLNRVPGSGDRLQELGRRARAVLEEEYAPEKNVSTVERVYADLIGG